MSFSRVNGIRAYQKEGEWDENYRSERKNERGIVQWHSVIDRSFGEM